MMALASSWLIQPRWRMGTSDCTPCASAPRASAAPSKSAAGLTVAQRLTLRYPRERAVEVQHIPTLQTVIASTDHRLDKQEELMPIRLLIVDDHTIVREGLRTLLSEEAEVEVIGEATNGAT